MCIPRGTNETIWRGPRLYIHPMSHTGSTLPRRVVSLLASRAGEQPVWLSYVRPSGGWVEMGMLRRKSNGAVEVSSLAILQLQIVNLTFISSSFIMLPHRRLLRLSLSILLSRAPRN